MTRIRIDGIIVSFDDLFGNVETAEELALTFAKNKNEDPIMVEIEGVKYIINHAKPASPFRYTKETLA